VLKRFKEEGPHTLCDVSVCDDRIGCGDNSKSEKIILQIFPTMAAMAPEPLPQNRGVTPPFSWEAARHDLLAMCDTS